MNSFFKSVKNQLNNRELAIKESLLTHLSENAKEIQYEFKENGKDYVELNDCTNSLCTTLEAIFLHGLKDSFLWQTINVISGDVDRRPEPSFWSPLLIFLHKQVIEQIQMLTQITTEIGCCRSWIRISLNDCLFSSYLNNIRKNTSALNPYYKKYAFIKDADNLEVAAKIIEGIETCVQINLPINSSLLNQWPDLALQLSGIWTPPLRTCPIANAIDVASSITDAITISTPQPLRVNEFFSESISNSPFLNQSTTFLLHPDIASDHDNVQILLRRVDEMQRIAEEEKNDERMADPSPQENDQKSDKIMGPLAAGDDEQQNRKDENVMAMKSDEEIRNEIKKSQSMASELAAGGSGACRAGNAIDLKRGWSGDEIDENTANNNGGVGQQSSTSYFNNNDNDDGGGGGKMQYSRSNSMTNSITSLRSPLDRHSYNTLLVRHNRTRELDWNDIWEKFESSIGRTSSPSTGNENDGNINPLDDLNGFEIIPNTPSDRFTVKELQVMVSQTCKLAREIGLDVQGFQCETCAHPLGIGFAPAQVCAFNGRYYCENCMSVEQYVIPAKIIYNWDFRKYSISKNAATFLNEFQSQPFIDFKILNPNIYKSTDDMANIQSLRIRLNFIRAYLFTCCEPIIVDLQKQVLAKEYLYEHIHSYSISDLMMIQKGILEQFLLKAVNFGEQHIINCKLCSQKGFICEICNSPRVLYPFHIDTTFHCDPCGAVFHAHCLNESQPCPKCERRRKREDLPLFEAVQNL